MLFSRLKGSLASAKRRTRSIGESLALTRSTAWPTASRKAFSATSPASSAGSPVVAAHSSANYLRGTMRATR